MVESNLNGQRVADYRLIREIGRGGMGIVYEAVHEQGGGRVAVKLLHNRTIDQDQLVRLSLEAKATMRVEHEGLVKVWNFGQREDGTPYMLMEFLQGESLRSRLDHQPDHRLPVTDALQLGLQIARALHAAHSQGVVHRDMKPENVMLVPDSLSALGVRCKILDFGLAKLLDERETTRSFQSGLGTPKYIAPERVRPDGVRLIDGRCDVYSVGVMIYEMLCGRPPFIADGALPLCWQHVFTEPESPANFVPTLPRTLVRLVLRMLAKQVAKRPTMEAVVTSLEGQLHRTVEEANKARHELRAGIRFAGVLLMPLFMLLLSVFIWWDTSHTAKPLRNPVKLELPADRRPLVSLRGALRAESEKGTGAEISTKMILIPPARFLMGSTAPEIDEAYRYAQSIGCPNCGIELYRRESPAHWVNVSAFLMDETEVTNEQFARYLNSQPVRPQIDRYGRLVRIGGDVIMDLYPEDKYSGIFNQEDGFVALPGMEKKPVVYVSWFGAQRFCRFQGKRLTTEAEFELAARGKERRRFPWGPDSPQCEGVTFGRGTNGRQGRPPCGDNLGTNSVRSSAQDRTAEYVFDLGGNVREWTEDVFTQNYAPCHDGCTDPIAQPSEGQDLLSLKRVVRGGSWFDLAESTRSATRSRLMASAMTKDIGFRCVRSAPPEMKGP